MEPKPLGPVPSNPGISFHLLSKAEPDRRASKDTHTDYRTDTLVCPVHNHIHNHGPPIRGLFRHGLGPPIRDRDRRPTLDLCRHPRVYRHGLRRSRPIRSWAVGRLRNTQDRDRSWNQNL